MTFNRLVIVITLAIIVVVTVYALSRPTGVALPSYLDRCVPLSGKLAYSSSFEIQIKINGVNQSIPGGIGVYGNCVRPVHTFRSNGVAYVDSPDNRTYTLQDFFTVWGSTFGDPYSTFNSGQLFSYRADASHHITLKVGNQTDIRFENYPLPTSGDSLHNPVILITYG
jgi:hypothetical protein